MPIIFYSSQDAAGCGIAEALRSEHGFRESEAITQKERTFRAWASGYAELVELSEKLTEAEFVGDYFYSDLFVFASRHASESGKPCFTTHATGDWGRGRFAKTSAFALKAASEFLARNSLEGFEAAREATHHGPFELQTPSLFIEVGSTQTEWRNEDAARLAAACVEEVVQGYRRVEGKTALLFGGGHYVPSHDKVLETGYAVSHICPKHLFEFASPAAIRAAIAATAEPVECALIDWKGCGSEARCALLRALEEVGLAYEKI
ncbi:MAG: D-aminoacyl-tRNA deacylase [Candidatus Norongarragalinales archaeon]